MSIILPPIKPVGPSNTIAILGDSRMSAQYITGDYVKSSTFFGNWANALSGQRMKFIYNGAISGYRSDQYLVNLGAAIATGASWLWIHGVINDVSQSGTTGDTALTIFNRIKAATDTAIAMGMNVVLFTDYYGGGTAALRGILVEFNERLREYASTKRGCYLFDLASVVVDPASASLSAYTAYSADGVHLNAVGSYYAGKSFATFIQSLMPAQDHQIFSAAEIPANGNIQQLANPLFLTTTGGTNEGGITGNVPASFTAGAGSGASATISTGADSKGHGNAVTLACTLASGGYVRIYQAAALGNFTLGTDIYDAGCEIDITAGASNFGGVTLWPDVGGTSNPQSDLYVYTPIALPADAMTLTLQSQPFVIPAGASWVAWKAVLFAAGTGSATITIRRPWLRRRIAV